MINAPEQWKRDLLHVALDLERRQQQIVWRAASFALLEKLVMTGAYSVRKLIESQWVDSGLQNLSVNVSIFASRGKRMYEGAAVDIDEHYDLARRQRETETVSEICSQLIHSFVFTAGFKRGRLAAIYFYSFRKRTRLIRISISSLAGMFRTAARSRHHILVRFGSDPNRYAE